MFRHTTLYSLFFFVIGLLPSLSLAQHPLLDDRWRLLETPHFQIVSQVSGNRTERFARDLEQWRAVASYLITDGQTLPAAAVRNQVFLFNNIEEFQNFAQANETAFFIPTPRTNFMAVIYSEETSLVQARHQYVHFLMRNFTDLRIPRWYEEGLAAYLSNFSTNRNGAELIPYSERAFEGALMASEEVTLEALFFEEEALGSPRLIQRANFKSEIFLHYLLHAHEEQEFVDRREQLNRYLELSLAGREQRFAFDLAFDMTISRLDSDFERYLAESNRPKGQLDLSGFNTTTIEDSFEISIMEFDNVAIALAELAINSGKFDLAEVFFRAAIDQNSLQPRSFSGLADALRMQEREDVSDLDLTTLYEQAINLGPQMPFILLDYGEYLETVLADCDLILSQEQEATTQSEIVALFERAVELVPDKPEANLAMGQYYLLAGQDFRLGIPYQGKALELLPADTFIMEQAIKYKIHSEDYAEAERLINELSQPMHYWQEFGWVTNLRRQLQFKQQGLAFDSCVDGV